MKGHFWYSKKQENMMIMFPFPRVGNPKNYAEINGKKVLYTTMAGDMNHGCEWDDMEYLGYGEYSHSDGVW